uniref:Metal dependent phosphohydrolase n=1 Tax=uncultured Armatimonadetes bacterium TaxID=157466 RepID=A0A6J4JWC7_9BACT|nr:metal dependent phosphohydrolase [uncultured Armatimonadetes bacterium]
MDIAERAPGSVAPSRARILLVDDDDLLRDTFSVTLASFGYAADSAASGEEALRMLRERAYDLVLSDVVMPGLSGLELADAVSRRHPDVPVVLLTGHSHADLAKSALRYGAADFLAKPVNIGNLPMVIERNLERRRMEFERLARRGEEVLLAAVEALVVAIDAKQAYTAQHSRRVATLALWAGESLALSPGERRVLELSAFLHDIGKIGTPDAILNKSAPLDPPEWEQIKQHPAKGCEILSHIPDLSAVAGIVRHHHERMDGAGYPDRLSGLAIPLFSRIISIVDAFEAMTSTRTYRPSRSVTEAAAELQAYAGTQFDPDLVASFLGRIERGDRLPIALSDP